DVVGDGRKSWVAGPVPRRSSLNRGTYNQGRPLPSWSEERMQKLADICIKQPIFAAMIILALVVVGAASYMKLGVDRFPSVDLPTARVLTTLAGASPEEMESQISRPLEDAINTVEGISQLWSISGLGSSIIIITFNLERN